MKDERKLRRVLQWLLPCVQWSLRAPQRLLGEYTTDDGRAAARNLGNAIVGAGIIAYALEQGGNEWLVWPIVGGIALLYYGTTRDRRER